VEYRSRTGHQCYHCKQWVEAGEPHDCWTTTEAALTRDLPEDLRDAWERLRETAAEFGGQRIYASHHCIMFSRQACYFFVRPKTKVLELCIFLGRALNSSRVKRAVASSKSKVAHIVHVTHRDEVEPPLTDWLREAYDVSDELRTRTRVRATKNAPKPLKSARKKPTTRPAAKRAAAKKAKKTKTPPKRRPR
jgi:hypothetical protein